MPSKLSTKSGVMAVNSFLAGQDTDIRFLSWGGFNYFYEKLHNVYPNFQMDELSYKSYQDNYRSRVKSWHSRKSPLGAAYNNAQSLVEEAALACSDWRSELKNVSKKVVKEANSSPSENSSSGMAESKRRSRPEGARIGDKLAGRYQCTELDGVWTSDETKIGKRSLVTVMDLGPRQIIGHRLCCKAPSGGDVTKLLIAVCSSRQRPKMFHSDSGGIFLDKHVTDWLKDEKILISRGHQKYRKHHNQVHERFNGTFKGMLVRKLSDLMGPGAPGDTRQNAWAFLDQMALNEVCDLVTEVIECYNSKFHRGVGASPNMMDTALAVYGNGISLLGAKGSLVGDKVEEFHKKVVTQYAGDWRRFFIDFYFQSMLEHKKTQARIERSSEKVIAVLEREKLGLQQDLKSSRDELALLQQRLAEMEKSLAYIKDREASREYEELERRDRRARRRSRKRKPLRDAVLLKEYLLAQSLISGSSFEESRDRVCFLFLFLCGFRVRQLRNVTASHVSILLLFLEEDNHILAFPGGKSASARNLRIPLPSEARPLILEVADHLKRLIVNRAPHEPVIVRKEGSSEVLSVTNLTKRLNRIMKEVSRKTKKFLRTHSFRVGLTTKLVKASGIEVARELMGHKDYGTTGTYNRHKYTDKELAKVLGVALKMRNILTKQ